MYRDTHNTTSRIAIAPPLPITTAAAAGAARPALVWDAERGFGKVGNFGFKNNRCQRRRNRSIDTYVVDKGPRCKPQTGGKGPRYGEPRQSSEHLHAVDQCEPSKDEEVDVRMLL